MTGWEESPLSWDKNLGPLRDLGVETSSQALIIYTAYKNLADPSSSGYLVPPGVKYTLANFPEYLIKCHRMPKERAGKVASYLELVNMHEIPPSIASSLIMSRNTLREINFSEREIKEKLAKRHLETKGLSEKRETIFKILGLS